MVTDTPPAVVPDRDAVQPGRHRRLRRLLLGVALPLLLLAGETLYCRMVLYQHYIWTDDVASYLFQAEVFAAGHLKVPLPAPDQATAGAGQTDPFFFRTWMVVPHALSDRDPEGNPPAFMFSKYPPGHPFVLFLGKRLFGSYEATPIALVLLFACALYAIVRRTSGPRAGSLALWLLALSPVFVGWGASLMSHNSTLFFLGLAMFAYLRLETTPCTSGRLFWGFLTAAGFGAALLCRPLTATCFALPVMLRELVHCGPNRSVLPSRWGAMAAGALLSVGLILLYNTQLTGHALRFPFALYWPRDTLGFTGVRERTIDGWTAEKRARHKQEFKGWEHADGTIELRQHTPWNGLVNSAELLFDFHQFFLVVPGALLLLPCLLLVDPRARPPYWRLCLLQVAAVVLGHALLHRPSLSVWGPRYYFELVLPLVWLLAAALPPVLERLAAWPFRQRWILLLGITGISFLHGLGICTAPYEQICRVRNERDRVSRAIAAHVKTPAIVFLRPPAGDHGRYIGHYPGHPWNRPDFQAGIIYAVNHGDRNLLLLACYPGRHHYEIYPEALYEVLPGCRPIPYFFEERLP